MEGRVRAFNSRSPEILWLVARVLHENHWFLAQKRHSFDSPLVQEPGLYPVSRSIAVDPNQKIHYRM